MKRSLTSAANQAKGLFAQAIACHEKNQWQEATRLYKQVLQLMPKQPDALHMLGVIAFQQHDFGSAKNWMQQAYRIQPNNSTLLFNLGNTLRALGNLDGAEEMYLASISNSSANAHIEALKNLGNVYKEKNEYPKAIAIYDEILALHPNDAYTMMNKGLVFLTAGDLQTGWPLYESRLAIEKGDESRILPKPLAPDWTGKASPHPLLVLPEQGLGDQIFYGALLADLQRTGQECFACLDGRLIDLFARSFPDTHFIQPTDLLAIANETLPFGAQIHLASLGKFFRTQAYDFNTVKSPYLLADSNTTQALRNQMQNNGQLVCGLSWDSQHIENGRTKRMSLQDLLPALTLPNVHFVDLQYGDTQSQRNQMANDHGVSLQHFEAIDNFHDIDKLASLIDACDVVVTVSNSTAHLAAALGKPTIVMLPHHTPLWYWHHASMTSPWYPSVTLLRQAQPAQWGPVVSQVATILTGLSNST